MFIRGEAGWELGKIGRGKSRNGWDILGFIEIYCNLLGLKVPSHHSKIPNGFPKNFQRIPTDSKWIPGFPMDSQPIPNGFSVDSRTYPSRSQRIPIGFPVDPMDSQWIPSGFPMDPQWIPNGFPVIPYCWRSFRQLSRCAGLFWCRIQS